MPRRLPILATDQIYHVFNRTVGHEESFNTPGNLNRIIKLTNYYRLPQSIRYSRFKLLPQSLQDDYLNNLKREIPLIQIFAFAFMPNHYHFLLKQNKNSGISTFISNLQNSFAKFFNIKNDRHGALFQSTFKAKRIETNELFIHTSRYIHLNPVTSYIIELDSLPNYPWTSLPFYMKKEGDMIDTSMVRATFRSKESYLKFIKDQSDYQRSLHRLKHLILD